MIDKLDAIGEQYGMEIIAKKTKTIIVEKPLGKNVRSMLKDNCLHVLRNTNTWEQQ